MADVDSVISSSQAGNEHFQLIDQSSIDIYLRLLIQVIDSTTFKMSQPFLIRRFLKFLSLDEHKTKGCDTPARKP